MSAKITYAVSSHWNSGFVLEVFVTNTGSSTLSDYHVDFTLPGTISEIWSGTIIEENGSTYSITDSDIPPGEVGRFKFKATTTSEVSVDDIQFYLNGDVQEEEPEPVQEDITIAPVVEQKEELITVNDSITASQLNSIIKSAVPGTTIQLEEGNYVFNDQITIERSDVSIVGAGSDKTHITMTGNALDDSHAFYVDGADSTFIGKSVTFAKEGDTTLILDDVKDLKAGDTLRIWQDNTAEYFEEIGDTSWQEMNAPLRTSMANVLWVKGNEVKLDRGVHFTFEANETKVERMDVVDSVNLEGFSLNYELGKPTEGEFENTISDLKDYQAVKYDGTKDSSITDVQVINGPSTAFEIALSLDFQGDALQAHGAHNKGSGGNGYAYELRELYDSSLGNLEDSGMRHSVVFASWRSSVGNEVHVVETDRDINFHGGQDHDNTVHVETSYRDPSEDNMSTTLWYNDGGHSWGSITDPDANTITFDNVIATKRNDTLPASDNGVNFDGAKGNDTVIMQFNLDEYVINSENSELIFERDGIIDRFKNIEEFIFADGSKYSADDLPLGESIPIPDEEVIEEIEEVVEEDSIWDEEVFPTSALEVTTNIKSEWSNGYMAEVFVKNTTDEVIVDPTLHMEVPADIEAMWNGLMQSIDDGYLVSGDGSGKELDPGEEWRFSFKTEGKDHTAPVVDSATGVIDDQVEILGVNMPDDLSF